MKQHPLFFPSYSLRIKAREFIERTILALGVSALLALATGAHAHLKNPFEHNGESWPKISRLR